MDKNITRQLRVIGTETEITRFEGLIKSFDFDKWNEAHTRHAIQDLLDTQKLKLSVLYAGNTVYGTAGLLRDLKRVVKADDMGLLSDALYKFFSLACGSIAHYDKRGWISVYPTVAHLRTFFLCNEFGQDVLSYQPLWATDRIKVVQEMFKILKVKSPRSEHYSGRVY